MDKKVKGIVLKLNDYKEADKLASIFTLEEGVTTAKFVGVKREKAKLKAIAQPFVFAEFNFHKIGNLNQVTSAMLIDNFYQSLLSYDKTICSYIVLDVVNSILPKNKQECELFLLTINALKNIETGNEFVSTIDYILKFIEFSGMGLEFPESDYVYFDSVSGGFSITRNLNSLQLDKKVYKLLKTIATGSENKSNDGEQIDIEAMHGEVSASATLKQILRLMHNILFIKFNEDIKSFSYL